MRYSIEDSELIALRNFCQSSNTNLENIYKTYLRNLEEWSRKLNSELVYEICRRSIGLLETDYNRELERFCQKFSLSQTSFVGISQFYNVGQEALAKMQRFQDSILPKGILKSKWELPIATTDNFQYSFELIREYKDLTDRFFNQIQGLYDQQMAGFDEKIERNILWSGVKILIEAQYEILLIFQRIYHYLFETFWDWYNEKLKQNRTLLKDIELTINISPDEAVGKLIQELLINILEVPGSISSRDGERYRMNQNNTLNQQSNNDEELQRGVKELSQEAIEEKLHEVGEDLETPKKRATFRNGLSRCREKLEEYWKSPSGENLKKQLGSVWAFIKKHRKPILKALGVVAPLIAGVVSPEGALIYKLLTHLPEIIDCFIGSEPKGEDLKKLELGLEFLKILFGKDLVNVADSRTIVLSNPEKVGKQVLQTIVIHNDYRKIFDIQKEDFNTPRDRRLYQSLTGERLPSVPSSRRERFATPGTYNHQMKNRSPQLNREQLTGFLRNLENLNQPDYRRHLFGINNSSLGASAEERPFVYSAKVASSSVGNLISRASSSKGSQYFLRKAEEASDPLFRDKELGGESSESNRSYRIRGNSQSQRSEKDRNLVQRLSLQNPRKGMKQGMKDALAVENTFGNLGQDLENVKSQLDSKKGYVSVKPDTNLGKLLNHLQTIAVGSEKESILPHHNYRYHPRDMEVLHEEMEREYSLINGIHKKPNLGRAVQNFVRRQVGYPVEYNQPTVKSINELIPLVDNGISSFSIATPQLMEKIQQAKDFVSNETNHLRKKLLLNYLSRSILGKTAYLALGVLLMTTSVWPVGLALSSFSLAGILTDQGSNAYAFLVANLGQDRTDELLYLIKIKIRILE